MDSNKNEQNADAESLICKSEALNDDFDNLGLFRSKNNVDREPHEVLYQVTIEKGKGDGVVTNHLQSYKLNVNNLSLNKSWAIHRNYDDFAWLFTALKVAFPGYILPYFCSANVIEYLSKKLVYLNSRQKQIYLVSRLQELRQFFDCIVKNPVYGYSDELEIFLTEDRDEYLKQKRAIDTEIQQVSNIGISVSMSENSSQKVLSLLQRGITWLSGNSEDTFHHSKSYLSMKCQINTFSQQLYNLTQKMFMYKHSKEDQISWKGSNTEIDAVELLTAKIVSGKPATSHLISQMQSRLLLPLFVECKKEGQLRRLLAYKENIEKSIHYLKEIAGNQGKINKLIGRDEKLTKNFGQHWVQYQENWLNLMKDLQLKFRQIIDEYSRQMYRIWK